MMKIIHLEAGRHLYGGAQQVRYLLEGLAGYPLENHLVAPLDSALATLSWPSNVFGHFWPYRGELDLSWQAKLSTLLPESKPDLLVVHSRRGIDAWVGAVGRRFGVKTLLVRRVDNPEFWPLAQYKYAQYDAVLTISNAISSLLKKYLSPEKLFTIHSAVNVQEWQKPCQRQLVAERLGLSPDDIWLGMSAQFIPRKGHHFLLKVLAQVLPHSPKVQMLLFGKGILEPKIRAAVALKPWAKQVHFYGFREDLPEIFPCLYLLLHPAFAEGLGVSLLQASAAGLPVLSHAVGGIPEAIQNPEQLLPLGEVSAWVEKLTQLLATPALREVWASQGKALAEKAFSVETMANAHWQLYQKLVKS
jgi:glycosyltransferase involved in cell wall biosynthesis